MEKKKSFTSRLDAKAFTLIELLVVVLIIGILAAVALPQYQKAVEKSKAMQLVTATKAIADAQKVYYLANGVYAEHVDELPISYESSGTQRFLMGQAFCTLGDSNASSSPRIGCQLKKPHVALQRMYGTDKIQCCSYWDDNFAGDSLCQQVKETKTWHNYCNDDVPCRCY